jgi:hypothetical protein
VGKQDIEQYSLNAEKSLVLATALFPDEKMNYEYSSGHKKSPGTAEAEPGSAGWDSGAR